MKVTIVAVDNRVSVNGFSETVDCSALPEDINVIQWYGKFGEIEFVTDLTTGQRKSNEPIKDFAPYKPLLDAWEVAAAREAVAG
jgi:hypothetical protein